MPEVRAEITANVGRVGVEVGQQVRAGDELVVLETAKTEIPVLSPLAGTVVDLRVAAAAEVQAGDVVAVIE